MLYEYHKYMDSWGCNSNIAVWLIPMLSKCSSNLFKVISWRIIMFVLCSDRFLPDKAIDLVDEAGSRVRLQHAQVYCLSTLLLAVLASII